ncbi:MAG: hypothetical protein JWP12_1153 [Bacteroidetes bacterium]|nr:hypothetical protein [Bacteroidota bacterium]
MEEMTTEAAVPATRPQFLTVLCILSFIGSGFFALISIIGMVASGWILGMLGVGMASAMEQQNADGMTPDPAAMQAAGGLMSMGTTVFVIAFLVLLILSGLSIFGTVKMWQQKKSGFIIYTVVNGLILVLSIIGGGWFMAIVTAAFIAMYAANLKAMK